MFLKIRAVVSVDHIDHAETGEGGAFIVADQVHRDKLWSADEGHALAVVNEMVCNARGFTVADVGNSTTVSTTRMCERVSSPKTRPPC